VGQAGTAAAAGLAVGIYEWQAGLFLILLGWVFAPIYLRLMLTTTPEFLERRFSLPCRLVVVALTLGTYVVGKIGAGLYAGTVLIEVTTGLSMWVSAPLIILAVGAYTAAGGLKAVLYTDAVQMCIFVAGGALGAAVALDRVGGQAGLWATMRSAGFSSFEHLVRPRDDADLPGLGMVLGQLVSSTWYWCLDFEMAQRVISARTPAHARLGTASAALLKVLPVFLIIFPGMCARALYERCVASDGAEHPTWCATDLRDPDAANRAYPHLVLKEFPVGLKGLMIASFLAAMMSSLAAVFTAGSTVFAFDVYHRLSRGPGGAGGGGGQAGVARAGRGGGGLDRGVGLGGDAEVEMAALRRRSAGSPQGEWRPGPGGGPQGDDAESGSGMVEVEIRAVGAGAGERMLGAGEAGGGGAHGGAMPEREQRRLVQVGRGVTLGMVVLSLLWLPVIRSQHGQLYLIAQSGTLHLAPPVVAVYVLGVLWGRANAAGALAGLVTGSAAGVAQLAVSMARHDYCESLVVLKEGQRRALVLSGWDWVSCLHFQYWALILCALSTAVTVLVSLCTPPPPHHQVEGAVLDLSSILLAGKGYRRHRDDGGADGGDADPAPGIGGAGDDRWVSAAGVALTAVAVCTVGLLFAVYW